MNIDMVKFNGGKGIDFRNKERIDERIIYEEVLGRIKGLPQAKHIEDVLGPSEDISIWEMDGHRIRLVLDIDYGVELLADAESAVDFLLNALR